MPIEDTEDRREYYRIEDMIALEILSPEHAETVSRSGSMQLFDLLGELHQLDFEAQYLLRQIAEGNRTLANYLKVQNKRIDLLGQALAQDLLKDHGSVREVVLSEGGISFVNDQPLDEDTTWTLKLVLMPQCLGLLLRARIASCQPLDDGRFAIGTSFEALTDAQRQLLARHILQKQATERRLARESLQGT
ncbi:pilus assembly protein PilZ [Stutzerimonas stutzeri]|uniref:Pilus assembly protein PilZ n=1 Tax=Stutzerimonas stutzeri TaxID=316 RepID=W8RRZ4_STUST|nr:PilZ domain-containing protein [Stutzerimonas stutzeri]AHL74821.1 pilus assembly protein PilZ [Stutzerimonas stutzeri]MCQ4329353.1 PilZ domain-containing protein [Stutzerimonas stutzeri]